MTFSQVNSPFCNISSNDLNSIASQLIAVKITDKEPLVVKDTNKTSSTFYLQTIPTLLGKNKI